MKPVVIACILCGAIAACTFRSTTVERPAPAPTTATVVTTEPPPPPPPSAVVVRP